MPSDDVLWCDVCEDFYAESRLDILEHLADAHTLSERLENNVTTGPRPEDSYAE